MRQGAGKCWQGAVRSRAQTLAYQQAYKHRYAPGRTNSASQGTESIGFWVGRQAQAAQTRQKRTGGMGGSRYCFLLDTV